MAVLDLHRHTVLLMDDADMEEGLDTPELKLLDKGGCRRQRPLGVDAGGMAVAAGGDLLGDVAQLHQARAGGRLLDEGADTRHPGNEALGGQFAERPVGGHPADAEALDDFIFGRNPGARRPGARVNPADDMVLDLGVERLGLDHGRRPRTILPARMTALSGLRPRG